MPYCSQAQVEGYLERSLNDHEASLFPLLEAGVEDYIDLYCGRTFDISRAVTFTVDNTVGDKSSNPFQIFDGGVDEIFFDTPLQTDTTLLKQDGTSAGVIKPYIGSYDTYTEQWTLLDPIEYVFFETNSKIKTSVQTRVGSFAYGFQNIFIYGTFADYVTPPQGIQTAATTLIANYLDMTDDLESESIEGYARVMDKEWNPLVARMLDSYKRVLL